MDLTNFDTPTLLLDKGRAISNIKTMISKCRRQNINFRPHFKTHQSLEVGRWYMQHGIQKITVSSVEMAEYFSSDGWTDILIAFPFNPREIKKINELGKKIKLSLTVPCLDSARLLADLATVNFDVMIKIDTGYGRSGISWDNTVLIGKIIKVLELNKRLKVSGLLTHSGNTYKTHNTNEVKSIYKDTVERSTLR